MATPGTLVIFRVAFGLLLSSSAALAQGLHPLQNPGFESGKGPWWGQGKWDVLPAEGVAQSAAVRVESGFVCQDKIRIQGGKNYRVSMQIRSDGAEEKAVFVQMSYRGSAKFDGWRGPVQTKRGEPALFVSGGTHDWKPFSAIVQTPPAADQILLYLRKEAGPGAAFYDDVKLEETAEQPASEADSRRAKLATELLSPVQEPAQAREALARAVALGRGAAPASYLLASAGQARFHLHTGTQAGVVVLGAVKDLSACLERISGAGFAPVSHDASPAAGPLLVVGRESALTAQLCPDIDYAQLGEDGFFIRGVGAHLVVSGATPRGTMYGVNWLLDRHLGVKWVNPDFTFYPSRPELSLTPPREVHVPRFTYREILSDEGSNAAFAAHNLLNGRSHGPSLRPTAPELDCWVHDWMAKGGSANFLELVPQSQYGREHPDWFTGGQVAMMNPGLRQAMAEEVIKRLRAHPDYTKIWYNIWQMDRGWDLDPASQAFAAQHGGQASAPRLDMMIDIANRVRAVLPGARLAFNAYTWGFTPPTGMTVPDYLLVFPMTIHVDYRTPLQKGRNEKLGADIVGWTRIARNVHVWDHITNWAGFLQPTPNIYPIAESIQWLATQPALQRYFAEGNWDSPGGEFSDLRAWLMARLLWDPQQNPHALVREFCDAYYGPAGSFVAGYIDLMHRVASRTDEILGQRYLVDLPMYDLDFVTEADALFDQAQAVVRDRPELLAHVLKTRLAVDYVVLARRHEYARAAAQRKSPWQLDLPARTARFEKALADNRVRQYRQGGSVKELLTMLQVERRDSTPPARVAGMDPADWREISDLACMRFDSAQIVADPAASDGAAIRMDGRSPSWAAQLQMARLPRAGDWHLFADVRVEAEPGHDGEPGIQVGSAPPYGRFNTERIGVLNDGHYHLVPVAGGPFRWDGDERMRSIYLASPAKPYLKYVYVDRLIAIRVPGKP